MLDLYFEKLSGFRDIDFQKKWHHQMVDKIVSVKKYNHKGRSGMDLEILMKMAIWGDIFCIRDERLWEFIQNQL
jgi:hypothetical protein